VREKDTISQTVNLKGHALFDNSIVSETSVLTESGDSFTSTKPCNIKDIGQRYQHTEAHSLESVGNNTYENSQSTKTSDSSNALEQTTILFHNAWLYNSIAFHQTFLFKFIKQISGLFIITQIILFR
jgi:hypothetical protein